MLRVRFNVLGEPIEIESPEPEGPIRFDELLPFMRSVAEAVIGRSVTRATEARGRDGALRVVSCTKGCSACCIQPVPVTPPEAWALLLLVERMPEERRETILARFADRLERLDRAGITDALLAPTQPSKEAARALAQSYLALRMPCPFLEEGACSIYADRPIACRQYLVTSPAELCADPLSNPVEVVPVPMRVLSATSKAYEALGNDARSAIPLALALRWAGEHREELERRYPTEEVFQAWIKALAGM